jgi:hypothetical protein
MNVPRAKITKNNPPIAIKMTPVMTISSTVVAWSTSSSRKKIIATPPTVTAA